MKETAITVPALVQTMTSFGFSVVVVHLEWPNVYVFAANHITYFCRSMKRKVQTKSWQSLILQRRP